MLIHSLPRYLQLFPGFSHGVHEWPSGFIPNRCPNVSVPVFREGAEGLLSEGLLRAGGENFHDGWGGVGEVCIGGGGISGNFEALPRKSHFLAASAVGYQFVGTADG